ncbi:heme ABC exporter ATP-binding protein CcmA [Psychrobacter sp.]|uniref:heme ABC exporter ATP-binding protein CcmA n=1 Tax=Psychrobacter sp. TaxID=56811 RepID=UPI0025DC7E0C|nr:heme ABC exporter ATP-binding protein CcmA [Psychrobacter sp.]
MHSNIHSDLPSSHSTPAVLSLQDITIQRGDFPLCERVTLTLYVGEICHLIGANGTGKTTLLMQLAGLLPLLEGKVIYQGQPTIPVAPLYVSHQLGIHPNLTVKQNLTFLLNLYGIKPTAVQIETALDWVDLSGFENMGSNQLSAGQTRRVTLARLYLMSVEQTPLWLLDEPFTALDVSMVARLQQRLQDFVHSGGSVLMTSHQPVQVANKSLNLSDYLPRYTIDDDLNDSDDDLNDSRAQDNLIHGSQFDNFHNSDTADNQGGC